MADNADDRADEHLRAADNKYSRNIFGLLAFIGITIKTCFPAEGNTEGTTGPAAAAVWGYGLVAISVAGLAFTSAGDKNGSVVEGALSRMSGYGGLFATLVCLISLNSHYYTQINKGLVASEYDQFSMLATIMIVLQLLLLAKATYAGAKRGGPGDTGPEKEAVGRDLWVGYLLSVLGIIFAAMQTVVLTYFSTDG